MLAKAKTAGKPGAGFRRGSSTHTHCTEGEAEVWRAEVTHLRSQARRAGAVLGARLVPCSLHGGEGRHRDQRGAGGHRAAGSEEWT